MNSKGIDIMPILFEAYFEQTTTVEPEQNHSKWKEFVQLTKTHLSETFLEELDNAMSQKDYEKTIYFLRVLGGMQPNS